MVPEKGLEPLLLHQETDFEKYDKRIYEKLEAVKDDIYSFF